MVTMAAVLLSLLLLTGGLLADRKRMVTRG
jgi:hypothetical protein